MKPDAFSALRMTPRGVKLRGAKAQCLRKTWWPIYRPWLKYMVNLIFLSQKLIIYSRFHQSSGPHCMMIKMSTIEALPKTVSDSYK